MDTSVRTVLCSPVPRTERRDGDRPCTCRSRDRYINRILFAFCQSSIYDCSCYQQVERDKGHYLAFLSLHTMKMLGTHKVTHPSSPLGLKVLQNNYPCVMANFL